MNEATVHIGISHSEGERNGWWKKDTSQISWRASSSMYAKYPRVGRTGHLFFCLCNGWLGRCTSRHTHTLAINFLLLLRGAEQQQQLLLPRRLRRRRRRRRRRRADASCRHLEARWRTGGGGGRRGEEAQQKRVTVCV